MSDTLRDNPNPRANIAIVLPPHFFFIDAFSTVLEHLPNAEFFIDFTQGGRHGVFPEGHEAALRDRLRREGVYWRDLESSGLQPAEFFEKYAMLGVAFYSGHVAKDYNKNKKKVRICYGTAKDSWSFGLQNAYFDILFCPGRYAVEHNGLYSGKKIVIGEPKHDRFYVDTRESRAIVEALGLPSDPGKQTILYMPTYGSLSSLNVTLPALLSLTTDYNVILKVHHMMMLHDRVEVEVLRKTPLIVLDQETSITDAFKVADIVMSDNSSSIFDALALGKPLVLIDPIVEKEQFFIERPFFGFINNMPRGAGTFPDSIEQMVKNPGSEIAPTVRLKFRQPTILIEDIKLALKDLQNPLYTARRRVITEELFAHRDGVAGKRAAEAMTELLYEEAPRDRVLERLVNELEQRLRSDISSEMEFVETEKLQKLEHLEGLRRLPYFEKLQALLAEYF